MIDRLYDNTPKEREAVRRGNEYGADLVQKHPIEYAFDTLKVDGIGIYTNDNQGRWPAPCPCSSAA
jgi:hypothetical protein